MRNEVKTPDFDGNKEVWEMEFVPDIGEQHRLTHVFMANDPTETFQLAVEAWLDGMCETHVLTHVRKTAAGC